MTFSDEQIETARALVTIAGPHGPWLEERLTEIVDANEFGEQENIEEAVQKLYRECPLWIRRRLFANRHAGRRSMFQAQVAFTKPPGRKPMHAFVA